MKLIIAVVQDKDRRKVQYQYENQKNKRGPVPYIFRYAGHLRGDDIQGYGNAMV